MRSALVALLLPLLSACTVPIGGAVALGMTADGEVVAHVQMCEGRVDGARRTAQEQGVAFHTPSPGPCPSALRATICAIRRILMDLTEW